MTPPVVQAPFVLNLHTTSQDQPALGRNLTYAPSLWDPDGPDPVFHGRGAWDTSRNKYQCGLIAVKSLDQLLFDRPRQSGVHSFGP